ncbi:MULTISPECIES: lipopolysaccharide assembly protein LapA domain-containing protein [unclassified Thermosynechococcus]|uniref:lipopolysaccharide assembly protein LapA domain-containing protein n=1 Tax=unclassified Thermosynechococcus TaxID=2622553 RepID=UPI00197CF235|nr:MULTISPECIES: lipopolysaccharide assembly protein LapA domain-containing protein [unclassified Thermosynechococcus]MDR5639754.1 lipopolysaccharide assembly protein LapA domain-containing protein [Thermosynechococcus sp. PP42]MDR7898835.1 lipopolysaccharide assembly protein LapA domain-containing protein [Thermosynechococcus sp. JY1332]MDR7906240.1 lipopolysaccharide assembly protein LapA domain-containing protein [Thermosynechococcus sp. JY1334]MDR7921581.1 lipopolysaccharide assembly protei
MRRFLLFLLWMISSGAIALFSVQNAKAVSLRFLFWQSIEMPLGLLLIFVAAIALWVPYLARPLRR